MTETNLRSLSFRFFLITLIFTPLAFGTVENWSFLVLETLTGLALFFFMLSSSLKKKNALEIPGYIPLFLFIALLLLQIIPLPVILVQFIAAGTYEMYRPLLDVDPTIHFVTLSMNPKASLLSLFTFTAFGLFYILTVYHLTTPEKLKKTTAVVVTLGVILSIEAILQKLTSSGSIFWFRAAPVNAYPVGPWVYSNHFAGYMEMIFPLAIALSLYYRPHNHYDSSFREKFVTIFIMPGGNRYLLLAAGSVLMAVSILFSLSRGGIITLCAAFLFFIVFSSRATNERRTQWAILITLSVVLLITWFGWQPIINEFSHFWGVDGLNTSGRMPVYRDTLNIIQSFPFFGTGSGTFVHAYPAFRSLPGESIFDHAHNDYLEMLADNGTAGFLLGGWFVAEVLTHTLRKLFQRRERYSILVASGALTGMLALLFHSLADFQIYNGANGLAFFFLAGLAVSSVNTRLIYRSSPVLLGKRRSFFSLFIPGIVALILLVLSPAVRTGIIIARDQSSTNNSILLNPNIPADSLQSIYDQTEKAQSYDPLEAYYAYRLGSVSSLLDKDRRARQQYLQAALLDPFSGAYLQQLGLALPKTETAQKDNLLHIGIQRDPHTMDRYLVYSKWLLWSGNQEKSAVILREALRKIPSSAEEVCRFVLDNISTERQLTEILSSYPYAWYSMGNLLEKRAHPEEAEEYYLQALEISDSNEIRSEYFTRLYSLYRKQDREEDAVKIVRQGAERLPDNPWFRIQLGDIYQRRGVEYRALEEYRKALQLDPDNRGLARKIWSIENR